MKTTIELYSDKDDVTVTFEADGKSATTTMPKAELINYINGQNK